MKRAIKILLISIGAFLLTAIVVISVAVWFVFTPQKLTPLVQKHAGEVLSCQFEIESVELTFFSTFPRFGLKMNSLLLANPMQGSQSDTLLFADEFIAIVDFEAWWKEKQILIHEITASNGVANIFADSLGNVNYGVFNLASDTSSVPSASNAEPKMPAIDLRKFNLNKFDFSYVDYKQQIDASLMQANLWAMGFLQGDVLQYDVRFDKSIVSFAFGGEKYLTEADVLLFAKGDVVNLGEQIQFDRLELSLNGLKLNASGLVGINFDSWAISSAIQFNMPKSRLSEILAFVPPSFEHYLEGLKADADILLSGSIDGVFDSLQMPFAQIDIAVADGNAQYPALPLPLSQIDGVFKLKTDFQTDSLSSFEIKSFNANTPKSDFQANGLITNLFSDLHFVIELQANAALDEFNVFIPDSLSLKMKGLAKGNVKATMRMSDLEKMDFDRMKLSGKMHVSTFEATYDQIQLWADATELSFSLPHKGDDTQTGFLFARISSDYLRAFMADSFDVAMHRAVFVAETSNLLKSNGMAHIRSSFRIDSLNAVSDTLLLKMNYLIGNAHISPLPKNNKAAKIELICSANNTLAKAGNNHLMVAGFTIETQVENHQEKDNLYLQWPASGKISMTQGHIKSDALMYPLQIPSIKLQFDPENIRFEESDLLIDESDFSLVGQLHNVYSYFKGDSLLRGKFNFVSETSNVNQLMAMTSGLGERDTTAVEITADTVYSGPYMVPKGIDVVMEARINKAIFGADTASAIRGRVAVADGVLLLDNVFLTAPAARMQLTAMYRTPRKNHLFLGLDYHMLDVEIAELLRMIPDIDTLMPMLRSFGGRGEFHLTVETYLDSLYNVKKSTLRGASSIAGQDLVLMDGETFSEIAKSLRFNKKTENRVDSMSAEFTIFRDEIDVYPFLIVMDKYKAVVGGRHNFDLSFDYHISLVESPLPIRLGVDVKGNMDKMSYRPTQSRYNDFYRPVSRRVVPNKQLELRNMIRESFVSRMLEYQ